MVSNPKSRGRSLVLLIVLTVVSSVSVQAGAPFRRRSRVLVPSVATVGQPSSPYAGTFFPTPYMTVRGNSPTGGGYSPLGLYGDSTMALYGPLSSLRSTAAPLITYSRGYDGRTVILEGTSFSTPNLPEVDSGDLPDAGDVLLRVPRVGGPPLVAQRDQLDRSELSLGSTPMPVSRVPSGKSDEA